MESSDFTLAKAGNLRHCQVQAMSELHVIEQMLAATARRRRWQRGWRGFWRGFLVAGAVWLLGLSLYKFLPLPEEVLLGAFLAGWLGPVVGFIKAFGQPITNAEAARWLDQEKHLKERLSTALEMSAGKKDGEWKRLLVSDAAAQAGQIDVPKLLPFHLPTAARWSLLLLALTLALGFVPEYRSVEYRQKRQDQAAMKEAGEKVAMLTKRSITNRPPVLENTKRVLDETIELGQQLQKAKLTRDDALKNIAEVTDKLKEQAKELAKNPSLQKMQQAAKTMGGDAAQTPESLQKQIESMKEALGENTPDTKTLNKLENEMEKLQKAAADMASKTGAEGEAAKKALSEAMAQMMKNMQAAGMDGAKLDEAMAALAAGKTDQFMKEMDAALQDLEKMKELAQALQNLQMAAQQLGKDLAEQLDRGQVAMAQKSLEDMKKQLQSGQMSKEEMQKLIEELKKAQKPGENYGKAGDAMSKALSQCQGGDKAGASQSLAEAIKALEDAQGQMADMQSLMSALENLKNAQMCVGNGQCWGTASRMGWGSKNCKGGAYDEMAAWFYHEKVYGKGTGGLKAGYGVDGTLGEADVQEPTDPLQASKVKGQISPGGQMPSITLKGVSIKGKSSVAFEEMAAAAQSEAESALTQDKVPRAYRGAVRDYFDDFKN
jgi:hypothetical protein